MYTPEKVYAYGDTEKAGAIFAKALSRWFDFGERLAVASQDETVLKKIAERSKIIQTGLEDRSLMSISNILGQEGFFFEDIREMDHKLLSRAISREMYIKKAKYLQQYLSEKLNRTKDIKLSEKPNETELWTVFNYLTKLVEDKTLYKRIYGRELSFISRLASKFNLDSEKFSVSSKAAIALCITRS